MWLLRFFSKRRKTTAGSRFRQTHFQQRIRQARAYASRPKIVPQARTDISLKRLGRKWWVAGWLLFLLFATIGYFLFFSDYFLARNVVVSGNQQLDTSLFSQWLIQGQSKKLFGLIPGNHLILFNRHRVEKILLSRSPRILRVSESRRLWPNTIKITIEERIPMAVWQSGEDFFYLSQDYMITEQLPPSYATSTQSYVRYVDITAGEVEVGQRLDVKTVFDFTQILQSEWRMRIAAKIREIRLPGRSSSEVYLVSETGWIAYFDITSDPARVVKSLQLIFNKEIPKEREKDLAYVDLRLATSAYYCYKGEPCSVATLSPIP